jgi:hypothetical protein
MDRTTFTVFLADLKEVSMQRKSVSRILMATTPIIVVWLVLASNVSAASESGKGGPGSGSCSNRTLFGDYGMEIEGIILGLNLPLRTVSMAHFDGASPIGNLSGVSHVVLNGTTSEEWRSESGTYVVNPNCTGVVTYDVPSGAPPLVFHFVVVKHGTEFHGVVDQAEITVRGYRVD